MAATVDTPDDRPRWRRWAKWLAFPAVILAVLLAAFLLVLMVRVPLPEDIAPGATTVFDMDGEQIGTLTGETTRMDVDLTDLPEHTKFAVLAAEDRDFYTHGGVAPLSMLRALVVNVRAGDIEQGGSTITQQYVKNAAVGTERTYIRKAREAAMAIKLDRQYDKDTVLDWYLDTVYWGRGAHGIGAAAETYFGRPASELNLNQSATLAGMIQAPENIDPNDNPERADTRRVYVLDGMLDEGWITQEQHSRAVENGLPEVSRNTAMASATAPYYLDAVRRELQRELGPGALSGELKVYTGLDLDAQQAAEEAVRTTLSESEFDADDLTAATVSIDPATGEVRAVVGGPGISEQSFNAAVQARRQVGSTFKAFTFTSWLEEGNSPESRVEAPAEVEVDDAGGETKTVRDYAGRDRGMITIFEALEVSANTAFVNLQEELGAEPIVDVATRMGLPEEKPDGGDAFSRGATMTLGTDEFSPLELAEAYNTFAAEGLHIDAHTIVRVEDATGRVIHEAETDGEAAISANDARTATMGMERVIQQGTGTNADIGRPAAGKTGTTQNGADGWFAGYTPDLTTVAWVGRLGSNEAVEGLSGGNAPATLWNRVMTAALEGVEPTDFTAPDLSAYEEINPAPEPCPDGYAPEGDASPPDGEGGEVRTEVAPGTEDREGGRCVRYIRETPSPTPSETTESETESPSPTPTITAPVPTESPTSEEEPTEDSTGGRGTEATGGGASGSGDQTEAATEAA